MPPRLSYHASGAGGLGDGRLNTRAVAAETPIAFGYDGEGLLTQAGAETLSRDSVTGLLTGTTLDMVGTSTTYNAFGERDTDDATFSATAFYGNSYVRDKLGRITQKTETVQAGTPTTYDYSYDFAGRLEEVETTVSAVVVSTVSYSYDANSNLLTRTAFAAAL